MAIITATEKGTMLDNRRLKPISVIPKFVGEKSKNMDTVPTNAQLPIIYPI